MPLRSLSCAVLVLCAASAGAQQRSSSPTPGYQPGVDVTNYDIRLELPDTGAFLRGDVTVSARRAATVRALRLDLAHGLTVRTVTVNGTAAEFVRDSLALSVPLGEASGDTVQVRVRYDGIVSDGLVVQRDAQGRWTWFGDNFPDRGRQWLPLVDHPSDKATVSFTVRAPSSRTVVANGTLLGITRLDGADAGRSETRWREAHPIATYLMVIGAGSMIRVDVADTACTLSATHRCAPQMVYATPQSRGFLPGPFAVAPAIVSYFESLVGPFPYEKLAHLQSATRFGGMENASAIFYADRLFRERSLDDGLIAHETAHQWFGDAVTEREWGHLWLSEGFATYFAALWTRHAHGDAAFAKEMAMMRDQILADSVVAARPVLDTAQMDYLALLNTNSYQKGGFVLFMLHRELGDSAFFGGLRAYYANHRDGNALSDDLRHELERTSQRDLQRYFDQWLRRPGVANVAVGWAHDASTGQVTLLALQEGASLPYELSVTVAVTERSGAVRRLEVRVPAERRAVVALPGSFSEKPRRIVVDPDHLLLARFTTP